MKEKTKKLDLDTFGEIVDDFLKNNTVQMLITLPEGTAEPQVEDNTQCGPVIQFYILLHALEKVLDDLFRLSPLDPDKKGEVLEGILKLIYKDLMEGGEGHERKD